MSDYKQSLSHEWIELLAREKRFLTAHATKQVSKPNLFLADKIPSTLQNTLDEAFASAFTLIFDQGLDIIEKTCNKDAIQKEYRIKHHRDLAQQDQRSLHTFAETGNKVGKKNLTTSGTIGIGMGVLGMGIPDIPIFTTFILKSIYEIALNYGFQYESPKERAFILMLIQAAVSNGEPLTEIDAKINDFIATGKLPKDFDRTEQIKATSKALSKELLYMKFLQGVPIVGAIGGAYDVIYLKQINEYANYKYQRRFLRGRQYLIEKI